MTVYPHVPHTRGDEPYKENNKAALGKMFPTHVGMNRSCPGIGRLCIHVPHTRGDEPERRRVPARRPDMFPTHVGMNRLYPGTNSGTP